MAATKTWAWVGGNWFLYIYIFFFEKWDQIIFNQFCRDYSCEGTVGLCCVVVYEINIQLSMWLCHFWMAFDIFWPIKRFVAFRLHDEHADFILLRSIIVYNRCDHFFYSLWNFWIWFNEQNAIIKSYNFNLCTVFFICEYKQCNKMFFKGKRKAQKMLWYNRYEIRDEALIRISCEEKRKRWISDKKENGHHLRIIMSLVNGTSCLC